VFIKASAFLGANSFKDKVKDQGPSCVGEESPSNFLGQEEL
jgi:hypothetical protein